MNNVAKSGAIVSIIGGSFMTLFGLLLLLSSSVQTVQKYNSSVVLLFSLVTVGLGITNIVLPSLFLKNKNDNFRIVAGILSIISVFFGWIAFFVPAILVLLGGILLLCGKSNKAISNNQSMGNSASVADIIANNKSENSDESSE